jgi:hypothetical protein
MATNVKASMDNETNKDQSRQPPVNLSDKSPSVHNGIAEADEARDSVHPVPLRINPQAPSPIAIVPGISLHHQSQYTQGHNSPYTGQNSPYSPSNPYRNVSQGSFYNVLQDNYRHSSIDSSSGWDSGSITPTNDRRRLTNASTAWGSRHNLVREEMSVPQTPSYSFEHRDYEKEPESPTMEDISPSSSTVRGSTSSKEEVLTPAPAPGPPPGPPAPTWSKYHEWLFIATVCSAQFLSLASLAQTISPLLIIGNDLNVQNPGQLAWFTASYSMTLGTFIIPAGRQCSKYLDGAVEY